MLCNKETLFTALYETDRYASEQSLFDPEFDWWSLPLNRQSVVYWMDYYKLQRIRQENTGLVKKTSSEMSSEGALWREIDNLKTENKKLRTMVLQKKKVKEDYL